MMRTVAASGESEAVRAAADYVCDGTDDHVQINAALSDVGVEKLTAGGNGGSVCLIGRRFNIGNPITPWSQTHLFGSYSWGGTQIFAQSKTNGWGGTASAPIGMVQLATANTQYVRVSGLTLQGQSQAVDGIYLFVGTGQEWDAQLNANDVRIYNVGRNGFETAIGSGGRNRAGVWRNIKVINPGVSGFVLGCPDYTLSDSEVGSASSHGIVVAHSNGKIMNTKSWYSQGNGFHVAGGRDNILVGCDAQDNKGDGFYLSSAKTLVVGQADSNGLSRAPGVVTGVGFRVIGSGTNLQGTASEKNEGGRNGKTAENDPGGYGWQEYGVQIVGTPKVIINVTGTGNRSGMLAGTASSDSKVNVVGY